ncbi:MAG: hypothetical protein ACJA0U_001775 [Salibacteraceae bacterium]|jgi:hypothetical protein
MKKALFSLLLIFVASAGTAAIAQEIEDKAEIEFVKEVHNYGTIGTGSDGTCTFEFENTGNTPLMISSATGSDGSTVPSWPKEPISPGATSKITVTYDTKRPGPINKSVTITSNATNTPTKVVRIKGNVTAKPVSGAQKNPAGPSNN